MCLDLNWRGMAVLLACTLPGMAQAGLQTQVNFDSGTQVMSNFGGTLLSPGSAADGDGAVIQLGYYSGGTVSNPFSGTWHALTGEGSLNTGGDTGSGLAFTSTSIGDIGGGAAPAGSGVFGFSLVFDSAVAGTFNDLPGATTIPLAIKFYNGTSIAGSTYYNVVSNAAWLWMTPINPSPLPPTINLSFDDVGLQWQSIAVAGQSAATAFHTSLVVVPEPDALFSAIPCLAALGLRRRRQAKRRTPSDLALGPVCKRPLRPARRAETSQPRATPWDWGVKAASPERAGQGPGEGLSRPFRAQPLTDANPGRCPGLACVGSSCLRTEFTNKP